MTVNDHFRNVTRCLADEVQEKIPHMSPREAIRGHINSVLVKGKVPQGTWKQLVKIFPELENLTPIEGLDLTPYLKIPLTGIEEYESLN